MSLPRRCIKRPVAVAMLFFAVAMLGMISFFRLPIDLLPDVAYPRLVIYTTYPDVGPSEVERFVTEPIERQVARVPRAEKIESVSREGISLVTLRFTWGTDMDFAVLNVREQLDNLRGNLPDMASRPAVLRTDPSSEPIMAVSVAGGNDLATLKDLAEAVFKRRLEQVDGVAEAALAGGLEREIHVEVDPRLLESYGFNIQNIGDVLEGANQSAPGGRIRRGRYTYALRTLGEFQAVDEIANVPLGPSPNDTSGTGNLVLLRDVATVEDGFRDRESIARYSGHEAVGLLLFKESGANTVRVADRVEVVLDQLRAEYPDIQLDVAMSQAGFITDAISNVVQALIFGGILAFLVLFLFLRHARYPIAVALAIPLSVVASFALLDLAGVSLNIMSLGGLALGVGMLVDNSIVVLENIFRHGEAGAEPDEAAARGAEEVQGAITASTLTTISVFGPIIYVQGVAGELFGALSFAVAFALMASLLVALTLLPTLAARWVTHPERTKRQSFMARTWWSAVRYVGAAVAGFFEPLLDWFDSVFGVFADWYHNVLETALDHRGHVVAFAAMTMVLGVGLAGMLDRSVLPDVDQGAFQVRMELARGTALEETSAATERLEQILLADPGIDAVFTRVGLQEAVAGVEDQESGLHTAVVEVRLKERVRTAATLARVQPLLGQFPPGALTIQTGTATALGRLLGGGEADLAVRVRGDDLDAAWEHARNLEQRLQPIQSLRNVRMAVEEGQPELLVEIDRERAAAFGIEPRRIAATVENYMSGLAATDFVDFDEKVPIVIRLPEDQRRSAATLDILRVDGIPLRQLVNARETVGPAEVRRLEQARTVTVYADAAGGLDAALADVRSALSANPAPRGLRVEVGGENEERDRSFRDLAFAFALALLLVYMILAAQFESFVHPFTILLSVPLATVGAAVALWAAGEGLNSMSLIGLVILVGIVVNDAIVKVDFINQMRRSGLALRQAILEAGRVRLRPIIMTTVTTVLGLTPMALGIGRGADLRAPLAIAVIGGLISATALTLVAVPVAYDLLDEARGKVRAMFGLKAVTEGPGGAVGGNGMIRLSIRRPVAVTMAYFGVALLGVAAWRNIPIELLPNTDLPQLTVEANWRGASPEAMEAFVTSPMESAIQQVRGVEKILSISADAYGSATAQIQVEFERDTDMDFARLDLSERLTVLEEDLPPGVDPPRVTPYVPDELRDQTTPFLRYEVTGPYTQEALRTHVDDRVVPELLLVEGVATVDVRGGRERVLQIELDERKINALGLNSYLVAQRISELEYVAEAGAVEIDGLLRTVAIRHNTKSAEEIRSTPLLTDQGRIVRVADVSVVHDTYEEAVTYNRINAQPAISFQIYKEMGVNTVEVADRVKTRMDEIANLHPVGTEVILDQDESEDIKKQLQDLRIRALVAAFVIFVVLLVFLRSFRSAAIVFMTIAFSILIALNLIYFGGFTLNVLTLMGLAMGFGLIVDNAIVVLENIYRKRQKGEPPVVAAEHGAREVVLPILAATFTTVIVFIPFVYLQGELRVFYVPLAIVVGMALIASLFVAFSFIPGLASKVLTGRRFDMPAGQRSAPDALEPATNQTPARPPVYVRFYAAILGFTLRLSKRRRWPILPLATVAVAVIAFGMSYYVFNKYVNRGVVWGRWGGSDTYIQIYIRLPRGAELERVDELTRFFEEKLKPMPEIERFTSYVRPEYASMRVTFPDSLEQTMVPVAIKEQMLAYSYLFGGAEVRVYGYGPSFYGGGGGSPNYTIKVLGYNYERVRTIAEDLGRRLERFSRVRDVDVNSMGYFMASRDKVIEFALAIDRQRLGLHGINTMDVVYQVASAVPGQGNANSQIRIDGEEVRYEVKLGDYEEFDVLQLEELLIRSPSGEGVRLGDVATLIERQVLNRVVREDQQYQRNVSYEFRGPSKLGDRIQEAVIDATAIPDGYRIEGRDEWRWDWEEEKQIWAVLAVALVLVFMVTAALFESLRQPLCVLLTVPMALIGVFLMFFYADASFTREAYIGVIMMGGIVVNNAILLVDHVNHLRRNEGLALQEATLRGTLERVRPILMTSTTTIFGLLPLVLFSEYADANIWNALGYALIGGLASSTILVLTVTPALYLMFELRPEKRRERAAQLVVEEAMA